jgi:hypothetical protein
VYAGSAIGVRSHPRSISPHTDVKTAINCAKSDLTPMSTIFNKLNLKSQTEILVLNAPESFEPELAALNNITIRRNAGDVKEIAFAMAFVTRQK